MTSDDISPPRRPLLHRFPALASAVPWTPLGELPTPVERAAALEEHLRLSTVHIKRDDLTAHLCAGSKLRKLEFLLAEARAGGHERVATWGGVGSNHAVATAAYGRQLGLKVTLLLLAQPFTPETAPNLHASARFGAEMRLVASRRDAAMLLAELALPSPRGAGAYLIEAGGTCPLGTLGFVNAALELDEQIRAGLLAEPDAIYIALGSMGGAVGLALGLALTNRQTQVIAVRASNPRLSSPARLQATLDQTVQYAADLDASFPRLRLSDTRLVVDGAQVGAGYAMPTRKAKHAVKLGAQKAGLALETTYTGKALAALIERSTQRSQAHQRVLFWQTHGPIYQRDLRDASLVPVELLPYAQG